VSYDPIGRILLTPVDGEASARVARLRELGIDGRPEPRFDEAARRLAELVGAPHAMVNFVGEERQFFAGLHTPEGPYGDRGLGRDHGFCPHVVVRRRALVLEDVRDFPRFAANPLVDEWGIRSYLGAPLMDGGGMALGTVCAWDTGPRRWGRQGLDTVKALAAELERELGRSQHGGA
jgi:GAF domain-containing protein